MKPYPLETLRALRADEEEAARRGLAEAIARAEAAAAETSVARLAVQTHAQATAQTLEAERARSLELIRVDDALRARAWRERRAREAGVLEQALGRAEATERAALTSVEAARDALARARTEREALEKHHLRWREEARRAAEAREEADAEDRPRRD